MSRDFDPEAMKQAINKCDLNVKIFEEAINKELNTKMEYQRILRLLEERANEKKHIKENIKFEIVKEEKED